MCGNKRKIKLTLNNKVDVCFLLNQMNHMKGLHYCNMYTPTPGEFNLNCSVFYSIAANIVLCRVFKHQKNFILFVISFHQTPYCIVVP